MKITPSAMLLATGLLALLLQQGCNDKKTTPLTSTPSTPGDSDRSNKSGGAQVHSPSATQVDDKMALAALEAGGAQLERNEAGLVELVAFDANATDEQLKHLLKLPHLQQVDLSGAVSITDDGLQPLGAIPTLKMLDLSWTKISGSGLTHLAAAKALEDLDLSYTAVEDQHLDALKQLKSLRRLNLEYVEGVTHAARESLRSQMDQLVISVNVGNVSDPAKQGVSSDNPDTPQGKFDAIVAERDRSIRRVQARLNAAKDDAEQQAIIESFAGDLPYAERMLALAEETPGESIAVEALLWVMKAGGKPEIEILRKKAVETLKEKHLENGSLEETLPQLNATLSPAVKDLLLAVADQSKNRQLRVKSAFQLARSLMEQADLADQIKGISDDRLKAAESQLGAELVASIQSSDPQSLRAEAATALEKIIADAANDADVASTVAAAKQQLFAIRNLAIGAVAPEIEGRDIDGNTLKLSDYRGRVVVLDFWGHW